MSKEEQARKILKFQNENLQILKLCKELVEGGYVTLIFPVFKGGFCVFWFLL